MIHGDRSQSQRTAALAGFQRGSYRILVATDLASRGIHVQDIAHVINYDMPADAESFIHRAGRTGRAGERGVASTLFARDQHTDLLQLERTLGVRMERMREGGDSWEKTDGASGPNANFPTPWVGGREQHRPRRIRAQTSIGKASGRGAASPDGELSSISPSRFRMCMKAMHLLEAALNAKDDDKGGVDSASMPLAIFHCSTPRLSTINYRLSTLNCFQ